MVKASKKTTKDILIELNNFSLPLILNSFFNILINSILAAIIGRISMNAIASTEVVDNFMYALIGILGVGTLFFNIHASRVRNTNPLEFHDWFKSIFILNIFIGGIAVALTVLFSNFLLRSLYEFEGDVLKTGTIYANIQSFSILFNMMIFAMSNLLKVMKKTKQIFVIGIFSSIFQLLFSYISVKYFFEGDNRIIGVALGSIVTLFIQVLFYIFLLRNEFIKLREIKSTKKREIIKNSIPLVFQEILEGSIFQVMIVSLISKLGINTISAYSVCNKMVLVALVPMYMYCNALLILVGENIESNDQYALKTLPRMTIFLTLIVYIVFCTLFYIFKNPMINFYTNIEDVKIYANNIVGYVFLLSAFQIFFECTKYALQSLGKEKLALKVTGVVNITIMILLLILSKLEMLSLISILSLLAMNYTILSLAFSYIYNKKIPSKINS